MAITDFDASTLSRKIHARELSCREVMQAFLARIHALNPTFNAIVNLAGDDVLLAQAAEYAVCFPPTKGGKLPANHKPPRDSLMTARMKDAGCIVIGKTTTPELGL